MPNFLRILLVLFVGSIWFLMGFGAWNKAFGQDWHVGIASVRSDVSNPCKGGEFSCDDSDSAGISVFAGRKLNDHFSIELGYVEFKARNSAVVQTGVAPAAHSKPAPPAPPMVPVFAGINSEWDAAGIELAGLGQLPIKGGVSALGRVGLLAYDADYKTTIPGERGYQERGVAPVVGVGLGYRLDRVSFRLMAQKYFNVDRYDVRTVGLSAAYHF